MDSEKQSIGRTQFDSMSLREQSEHCLSGGTVFEDREDQIRKPDEGLVTSLTGETMPAHEFEAMPVLEQAAFIKGGRS